MTDAPDDAPSPGIGRWLPLIIFLAVGALFAGFLLAKTLFGYERDVLPSAMIGRPAPETPLPPLFDGAPGFDAEMLRESGVKLVNVWASWCGPCRVEHPFLMRLAEQGVTIHGMNHRDEPNAAKGFLAELGDPYDRIGVDRSGRAGVDWGVYGVPETFVINGRGEIVHKHVGPILEGDLEARILPAIRAAAID